MFDFLKNEYFNLSSLAPNSFPAIYKKFSENFIAEIHKNKNIKFEREFEFKFLKNSGIEAYADCSKKSDYIHISIGTVMKIHDLFYKLFSNPKVFSGIGNHAKEFDKRILDFKPFIKNKTIQYCAPNDKERFKWAQVCSMIAMEFIILHEIGHHINGHCLLGKEYKYSKLDKQTIEMDADSFAVSMSIQSKFIFDTEKYTELQLSRVEFIELWIYIIHIVFLFISSTDIFIPKFREGMNYLPRRIRSLLSSKISMDIHNIYFPNSTYDFNKIFNKMAIVADMDFHSTFNISKSDEEIISNYSSEMVEHLENINKNWDEYLRDRLEPYSRVDLFDKNKVYVAPGKINT